MLSLDHLAVLGTTLPEAVAHCETAFDTALLPGGQHAAFATHNQLLGLEDGLYLEAIAIDPQAPNPGRPRWFGLDAFDGPARLNKWICRVPDMEAALQALPEAGTPVRLTRGDLAWTMAVPADGQLPFDGMFPALIQWHSPKPPGDQMMGEGRHLTTLTIQHPQAKALQDRLSPLLHAPVVQFETANEPALHAIFATPRGPVHL